MEEVAGLYLAESEPTDLALSEATLMEKIAQLPVEKEPEIKRLTSQAADKGVPLPLAERLPVAIDDIPWKKLVPGISHYPISQSSSDKGKGALRLLKIAPGTPMPEHSHSGQELTMILSGSYIDDLGRFQAGDVADLDDETWHRPVADTDRNRCPA
jgi:putative transcriptional regulator